MPSSFSPRVLSAAAAALIFLSPATGLAQPVDATATPLLLAYNPGNTNLVYNNPVGVKVSPDGRTMQVTTLPVGAYQGGLLNFGTYPWWVSVADFKAGNKVGYAYTGDYYRGSGSLVAPAGRVYTAATLLPDTTNVYQIQPVELTGIKRGNGGTWAGTMRGTITTDGKRGKLVGTNIIDFDIVVEGTQTP